MKTKSFNKKLSLHKTTVANIDGKELNRVLAGGPQTYLKGSCGTVCYSYFNDGTPCPWPCHEPSELEM